MSSPSWNKTIDLSSYTPVTLTNDDIGKRFILADGNIRQIGTFNRFSPDQKRAYFTYDGKTSPISVNIDPLTGYKVYSIDQISLSGTSALTNLPTDLQKNIATYYGGKRVKRVKRTKSTFRKNRVKSVKRKSRKSRRSRKSRK